MDTISRILAITIEVLILAAISYAVLKGVRLATLDLGIKARYGRAVTLALLAVGVVVLVFFIAHLTAFYPGAGE